MGAGRPGNFTNDRDNEQTRGGDELAHRFEAKTHRNSQLGA